MTLTCNASRVHAAENIKRYWWYLGAQTLREIPGNTLKARVSGTYKCQIQGSSPSDGVSLIFSSGERGGESVQLRSGSGHPRPPGVGETRGPSCCSNP